jgi:hypothetical protein
MFNFFWPYPNRDIIYDFLYSLRKIFNFNNQNLSISPNLDLISHNILLENLQNNSLINEINNFCKINNKKISIIATEFLEKKLIRKKNTFFVNNININSETNQIAERFRNLLYIKQNIISIINIFSLPDLKPYYEFFNNSDIRLFNLPSPNYKFNLKKKLDCHYDFYFSGLLTNYRLKVIDELSKSGFKILYEKIFVDDDIRNFNIKKANFCLNIPQDEKWKWSSTMRYLHALKNGKLIAEYKCHLLPNYFSNYCLNFSNKLELYEKYEKFIETQKTKINLPNNKKKFNEFLSFIEKSPYS